MKSFGMREARARLSALIDLAHKEREVILTRRGVEVARIVPIEQREPQTKESAQKAIEEMRKFRAAHPLRGFTIKQLIREGRRH